MLMLLTCLVQGLQCQGRHAPLTGLAHQVAQQQHTRLEVLRPLLQKMTRICHEMLQTSTCFMHKGCTWDASKLV